MSRYNQDTCHSNPSFPSQHIREQFQILTIKKPAHPSNKSPERLALNSSFHTPFEERLTFLWLGLTSYGSLLDGGGRLQAQKYHLPHSCQAGSISAQVEFWTTLNPIQLRHVRITVVGLKPSIPKSVYLLR